MSQPKQILLLGATGSIGTSTLNCVRRFPSEFTISGIAAEKNVDKLIEIANEFHPQAIYIKSEEHALKLRQSLNFTCKVYFGENAIEKMANETDYDVLVNALVGAVGLRPTVASLMRNKKVALANKETLVIGGDYINSLLKQGYGSLIPIDSEHSAILQCIAGAHDFTVESLILTASGGPFRNLPEEKFCSVTPEQALSHPTWSMGKKITIDSSTLMNKGFEIIEAHHLFHIPYENLRVWIHPQSIIHSLVEFHDGAVMAQLGLPDMELPIQYALTYPYRRPIVSKRLSLPEIGKLEFFDPDLNKFPCLSLCIEAGKKGGTVPAVLNAANEIAVYAFINGKIKFTDIAFITKKMIQEHTIQDATLENIEKVDKETRFKVQEFIQSREAL